MAAIASSTDRRPKLAVRVVEALRTRVAAGGTLHPGAQLPTEQTLTREFGVSRTVVREALAVLAADGLIEARQGSGNYVAHRRAPAFPALAIEAGNKLSIALNILEIRIGIEIESAGLAAERRNSAQEAAIHEAVLDFDRQLDLGQATGKVDLAFHRAIALATNNPFYVEVLDSLGERTIPCDVTSPWGTDRVLTRAYQQGLQREHLAIFRAISAGDVEAARTSMRTHLANSQQRYRTRLDEQTARYEVAAE